MDHDYDFQMIKRAYLEIARRAANDPAPAPERQVAPPIQVPSPPGGGTSTVQVGTTASVHLEMHTGF